MRKITYILAVLFFVVSCSSIQKTNSETPQHGFNNSVRGVDVSQKSAWEQYSYGLFYKNQSLKNKNNIKGDQYLNLAIKAFLLAEKSGKALDLVYYQLSDCYFIDYNYAKSLDYAYKSIQVNNKDIMAYRKIYEIHSRLKNHKKAAKILEQYLQEVPNAVAVWFVLAEHYYEKLRDYNKSLNSFEHVIALSNEQAVEGYYLENAYYYSGFLYYKQGDINKSINSFEKVYELNPNKLNSVFFLAQLYMIDYDLEKANFYAQKYYKVMPDNQEINTLLGRINFLSHKPDTTVYFRKGRKSRSINGLLAAGLYEEAVRNDQKAEKILKSIIRFKPQRYITPYIALARISERSGDSDTAFLNYLAVGMLLYKKELHKYAQYYLLKANSINDKESGLNYYLGRTYEDSNNISLAIVFYKKALVLKPSNDLTTHIGYLYGTTNQYDKAFVYLDKAMAEEPRNSRPYFFKGVVSLWQKNYEIAEINVKKAIDLQEKNDTYHYYHAIILEKRKKIDEAIKSLNKAIKYNPKSAKALNYLGYLYADMDINIDESLSLIEKAVELDPNNGAYIDSLGWVYYRKGDFKQALKNLLKAEKLLKDMNIADPVVYDHIGDTYIKMGENGLAIQYWKKAIKIKKSDKINLKIEKYSESPK